MKPLMIDLYCGLGGWSEGGIAAGYHVVGFDVEAHQYGSHKYPSQLVLQDVRTLHGAQFRGATLIVASPPCQEFSYMAMPWKRAKQIERALKGKDEFPEGYTGSRTVEELNRLFDACFRIQRQASEAAGHHIPLVVENVRGAQKWVGRADWHYGSYYLWGDVPALMPIAVKWFAIADSKNRGTRVPNNNGPRMWSDREVQRLCDAYKSQGMNWSDQSKRGQDFTRVAGNQAIKHGGDWFGDPSSLGRQGGVKQPGIGGMRKNGKGNAWFQDGAARSGSKSRKRKMASAMMAKIPLALARHIARVYFPLRRGRNEDQAETTPDELRAALKEKP